MSISSNSRRTHTYKKIDPKIFAKRIFAWLAQIKNDRGLPPSGALFALQLIEHFNRDKGGAAWPSGRHIADQSGMSTANVVKLYHLFEQRGHLKVEWGKRGNGGHSNRCWMVIKPLPKARRKGHPDDLSKVTGVTFNKASVKGHKSGVKGHPNDQNHLRTTLVVSKMRESPPLRLFLETELDAKTALPVRPILRHYMTTSIPSMRGPVLTNHKTITPDAQTTLSYPALPNCKRSGSVHGRTMRLSTGPPMSTPAVTPIPATSSMEPNPG